MEIFDTESFNIRILFIQISYVLHRHYVKPLHISFIFHNCEKTLLKIGLTKQKCNKNQRSYSCFVFFSFYFFFNPVDLCFLNSFITGNAVCPCSYRDVFGYHVSLQTLQVEPNMLTCLGSLHHQLVVQVGLIFSRRFLQIPYVLHRDYVKPLHI